MNARVVRRAAELEDRGELHAIATVVRVDRPVSARPGDCALITRNGGLEGWVGGSCSEPIVLREAVAAMSDGTPRLVRIRPVGAPREPAEAGVVTEITTCASEGGLDVFVQPRLPATRLAIAGSSPAARTLVRLGGVLGYRTTAVLDDPSERLPGADATITPEGLATTSMRAEDAVVAASMSRYDDVAIEAALETGAGYIGLVASRERAAQLLDMLRAAGVPSKALERVTSPAGLDLGPCTQEEIAVAILAEIVAHGHRTRNTTSERLCLDTRAEQAADPVCGMTVAVVPSTLSARHRERTYYFCSSHCREAFVREPEGFGGDLPRSQGA